MQQDAASEKTLQTAQQRGDQECCTLLSDTNNQWKVQYYKRQVCL